MQEREQDAEREAERARLAALREQEAADRPHVVYYVRLGENHIKIGTTSRLPERMVELRVANPANLLAAEPGGFDVEKRRKLLHRLATELREDASLIMLVELKDLNAYGKRVRGFKNVNRVFNYHEMTLAN